METVSRLALMAVLSRAGSPAHEKATWNGSDGYLPIITVQDYDTEAAAAAAGKAGRKTTTTTERGGDGVGAWSGGEVAFSALLGAQCLFVVFVEGWIVWMGQAGDFELWNWLCEFASPGLLVLFSVSFSAMLLHAVRVQTRLADLAFQAAGLIMATFCAVMVCAGASGGARGIGLAVVVGGVVVMWFSFFAGFWWAVLRLHQEQRGQREVRKGKTRERGYGTTSGGLAMEDETFEGLVGDLS
ncbi:uncharacterized protein CTRU02_210447 [Colletotrichum truncatum]|uniref:Uncharacterized protein n=1 Tax=Colletotrichum truncatum TaxID=5467 RepID=A0ACC3YNZ5_COLTU|nr:uncharacterized protein CTRU02_13952 [Colletotrichum truncatum]KAF6782795.1 hypothetical protein CTRU02_13952 [Colletotrichum truncatum]